MTLVIGIPKCYFVFNIHLSIKYLHVNARDESGPRGAYQRIFAAKTSERKAEYAALDEFKMSIYIIFWRTNLSEEVEEESRVV